MFSQFETDTNNETIDSYIIVASQLYINISNTQLFQGQSYKKNTLNHFASIHDRIIGIGI
jgi:hypothetical protein